MREKKESEHIIEDMERLKHRIQYHGGIEGNREEIHDFFFKSDPSQIEEEISEVDVSDFCPDCDDKDGEIDNLKDEVAGLEERIRELENG